MKSQVTVQLELAENVFRDVYAKCVATTPDYRDLKTIRARVKQEGLSFLTITLPKYAEDFQRSLALGRIDRNGFLSFKKSGQIPAFLQGIVGLLFDQETGDLREPPDDGSVHFPTLVEGVRQLCLTFKKLEMSCTPARVSKTIKEFVQVEHDLSSFEVHDDAMREFDRVCSLLWDGAFSDFDREKLIPSHGPGATAERISGNQKYVWMKWHDRLEPYFHLLGDGYSISAFEASEFDLVSVVPPDQEQPVRVSPVPKTMKGPRIIAIEPCCMQYAQQAIRAYLYDKLEKYDLTRGHVNFTDQSVNRGHALSGSKTGRNMTLDLSEASDRVSLSLASRLFASNPELLDSVMAARSTHAELPDGTVIGPLYKFASMGSALCFPVESMVFYTLCIVILLREHKLPVTRRNIKFVSRAVYVYGDDIVVPAYHATAMCDGLQEYNCKVNMSKTFWNGYFRESCGMDAYRGEEVTPTYVRSIFPSHRRQAREILSLVSTAHLFYKKGYWRTASYIYDAMEALLGPLPYVGEKSPGLGRISYLGYRSVERWNEKLQRFEVKCWVPSPVYRTDKIGGYAALQKSLINLEKYHNSSVDEVDWQTNLKAVWSGRVVNADHLEQSARYGTVTLKRRWVPSQTL